MAPFCLRPAACPAACPWFGQPSSRRALVLTGPSGGRCFSVPRGAAGDLLGCGRRCGSRLRPLPSTLGGRLSVSPPEPEPQVPANTLGARPGADGRLPRARLSRPVSAGCTRRPSPPDSPGTCGEQQADSAPLATVPARARRPWGTTVPSRASLLGAEGVPSLAMPCRLSRGSPGWLSQ